MAFTLYMSTDTNAPILEDAAGSLLNILRKCLVQGYGEQTPAGWDENINADNLRGAFRSLDPASPQHWFYIDDTKAGAITTVAYGRAAFAFGGWDGADDPIFTDPYPSPTQRSDGLVFHKSHTTTGGNEWALIADGRTCWWFSTPRGSTPLSNWTTSAFDNFVQLEGFGDTVSLTQSPAPSFMAGGLHDSNPIEIPLVIQGQGGSNLNDEFYLAGNAGLSTIGIQMAALMGSGAVVHAPTPVTSSTIFERERIFRGGDRIERLRGLREAFMFMDTEAEYTALFGAPSSGNPGIRTVAAGGDERLVVINGRVDNSRSGFAILDLNEE